MNYKISKRELKNRLDSFQVLFRKIGIKVTPKREEIYRVLLKSSSHPSADKIFQEAKLRFPKISLDTVYRNVESLEKVNLVNRIPGLEGKNHFEANIEQHHHFICTKCQTIYDFKFEKTNRETIQLPFEAQKIGKAESTHLLVKGICKNCISS